MSDDLQDSHNKPLLVMIYKYTTHFSITYIFRVAGPKFTELLMTLKQQNDQDMFKVFDGPSVASSEMTNFDGVISLSSFLATIIYSKLQHLYSPAGIEYSSIAKIPYNVSFMPGMKQEIHVDDFKCQSISVKHCVFQIYQDKHTQSLNISIAK